MSDLVEQIESLERFAGSPGWQEMRAEFEARQRILVGQMVHVDTEERDRSFAAAQYRVIEDVIRWPGRKIQSLTDQRERDEQGGHDGEG